jgi:predicted MPP superfamily phosphohydrolase
LVGVDDPHVDQDDYPSVSGPISGGADLHIGVTHTPASRVLNGMASDGFTLLWPATPRRPGPVPGYGALTTNCDLPRDGQGPAPLARLGRWLHVSAGLGTHPTAPIRFACRPEASVLTLIPR